MKKLVVTSGFLVVVLGCALAFGVKAPYPPWISLISGDFTFSDEGVAAIATAAVEGTMIEDQPNDGTTEGYYGAKVVRFVYDVASDGGSVGAHALGATLPAGAVIIRSYFKIITQFSDSGSGTVALHCEDANNIKTATDITGSSANAFVEGQSTGAASAFVRDIAAACTITATVATATQDAGKLMGWVHYVVED